ncbi:MAG: stage II sporulation protein M [Cyclobacteriaceae bacterium]|nr:stage II sporulation protein M [Cyclobacteriaceae bacterium]MBX2956267.1 stage II sporulation protein M [Cyclobacteriaceae bacterium]
MREAAFVKRNQQRWQEIEQTLTAKGRPHPDRLAEIFIQLTDDLSFARTQYPKSRVTQYLNNLASKIHLEIYKNKKEEKNRFITFWKFELPMVMFESRKPLLYAFLIFTVAILIGGASAYYDETFVRLILGDAYVNMTLENIEKGNPTAVFSGSSEGDMFFAITFNNIRVSFYAFVAGLFFSLGTGYILFSNGIMVGAIYSFFLKKELAANAFSVIMLHGTIELSVIVVAGAAGLVMGNSFLFPGTYSRLDSFKQGVLKGVKIVMGLVPFFILAGFIESFITRYAFMHWSLKTIIISLSAWLILYYFVIYPYKLVNHGKQLHAH